MYHMIDKSVMSGPMIAIVGVISLLTSIGLILLIAPLLKYLLLEKK